MSNYYASHEYHFDGVHAEVSTQYFPSVRIEIDFSKAIPCFEEALAAYVKSVAMLKANGTPDCDIQSEAFENIEEEFRDVLGMCNPLVDEYYGHGYCDDPVGWMCDVVSHYNGKIPLELKAKISQ